MKDGGGPAGAVLPLLPPAYRQQLFALCKCQLCTDWVCTTSMQPCTSFWQLLVAECCTPIWVFVRCCHLLLQVLAPTARLLYTIIAGCRSTGSFLCAEYMHLMHWNSWQGSVLHMYIALNLRLRQALVWC